MGLYTVLKPCLKGGGEEEEGEEEEEVNVYYSYQNMYDKEILIVLLL